MNLFFSGFFKNEVIKRPGEKRANTQPSRWLRPAFRHGEKAFEETRDQRRTDAEIHGDEALQQLEAATEALRAQMRDQ